MKAYFSGTDTTELFDNVGNHEYYLSIIVNYSGEYVAKMVFLGEQDQSGTSNSKYFNMTSVNRKIKVMFSIDMNISKEPIIINVDINKGLDVDYASLVDKDFIAKSESLKHKPLINKFNTNWYDRNGESTIGFNRNKESSLVSYEQKSRGSNDFKGRNLKPLNKDISDGLEWDPKNSMWVSKNGTNYKYDITSGRYFEVKEDIQTELFEDLEDPTEEILFEVLSIIIDSRYIRKTIDFDIDIFNDSTDYIIHLSSILERKIISDIDLHKSCNYVTSIDYEGILSTVYDQAINTDVLNIVKDNIEVLFNEIIDTSTIKIANIDTIYQILNKTIFKKHESKIKV